MGAIEAGKAIIIVESKDKTAPVLSQAFKSVGEFVSNVGKKITSGLGSAFKGLGSISGLITKSFASVGSAVISTFKNIGIAAKQYITDAMEVFKGFDDTLLMFKATTTGTEEEYQRIRKQARELGRTTQFAAKQVGEIQVELGKAGFARSQVDSLTKAVVNLSAATGTEAATSSGILAATIRQFSLEASDAARVSDVLTLAANQSFSSVEELGTALGYVGKNAADLGMEVEDTLAVLMQLANLNLRGSLGGTGFRNLLIYITSRNKELKKLTGVESRDKDQNLRPIKDIMAEIGENLKGKGNAEKMDIFGKLFGTRSMTTAGVIASGNKSIVEFTELLKRAAGTADKSREIMASGWGGAVRSLTAAMDGLKISIGEMLAPILKGSLQGFTVINNALSDMVDKRAGIIAFLKEGSGAVQDFVRGLISWSDSILEFFKPINAMGQTVIETFAGISNALAQDDFAGGFQIAMTGLETLWTEFKNYVLNIWGDISTGVLAVWEYISSQIKIGIEDIVTNLRSTLSIALLDISKAMFKVSANNIGMGGALAQGVGEMMQEAGIEVGLSSSDIQGSEAAKATYASDAEKNMQKLFADNEQAKKIRNVETRQQNELFKAMTESEKAQRKLAEEQAAANKRAVALFGQAHWGELPEHWGEVKDTMAEKKNTDFAISSTLPDALERGSIEAAKQAYGNDMQKQLAHLVESGQMTARASQTTNELLQDIKDEQAIGVD